jgi:hypothetical protein
MIITNGVYATKWQAEEDYNNLIYTLVRCFWLSETARHLKISPHDMYEVVKIKDGKWKINATPEHLAATQEFYKIV